MPEQGDIAAGRLQPSDYAAGFNTDAKVTLDQGRALIEASRCYFCYDAPCVEACPTGIDIPSFIRKISTHNIRGAALDILEPNIFGGACARVCPVEELCEEACVRDAQETKPVSIGLLQRFATDHFFATGEQPFARAPTTGKKIAVVGAGPAGLSCAHRLARLGHAVTVYDAHEKAGGLNEYGIAAYKVVGGFAQTEVDFILSVGGITVENGKALGKDLTLDALRRDFDAVFLAIGQAGVRAVGVSGEDIAGVEPAVDFIARLRQAPDLAAIPVGRRVVVIGGGNTAIDAAIQSRRLGAEDVTMMYRRGPDDMGATDHEQEFAKTDGVKIKYWAKPVRFIGANGALTGVEFEYTRMAGGKLEGTGDTFVVTADMALTAVGQILIDDPISGNAKEPLSVTGGRIVTDGHGRTSLKGVYAGGDCVEGKDLTVQAVEDGKNAALAIDGDLRG
ncbi:MAG: NAD(P)-dependent oxidoreductase [Alphaproteobacteria bacterium]|nr:NAD(P)-dependent oxidoreductase [Alphaproteobacteria bacterium]